MKITWFGHAALGIKASGVRILTDPYSSKIGFAPINEAFDVVTLSHHNPDYHSCLDEVLGSPQVLEGLDLARSQHPEVLRGISFGAVEVAGDEEGNEPNAMVWIEADGMRVLHMGDCGHQPTSAQVAACGRVDVLLALAGGAPTLSIESLLNFIEALSQTRPPLVIPMHYGVEGLKTMKLLRIEELGAAFGARFGFANFGSVEADELTLSLTLANLPHTPLLMCLPSAR